VALSLFVSPLLSAETTASDKLTIFVQTVVTFKAKFEQNVLDAQGKTLEQAQGQFVLERPGKFRWDYYQPYPQHIVADGQQIWFYDVDLEQVTVKSQQEALTSTPATLLSGEVLPSEKYYVSNIASDDGLSWVKLVPKDAESNFQTVSLAFDGNELRQMLMKDSFDQLTQLIFSDGQENVSLATKEFVFIPPEGVDVVGDANQ
jgi:outer membrane lipoprotein carrier protein